MLLLLVPVIIATATFNLAVQGTQSVMTKVGQVVLNKFHKPVAIPAK